MPKLSNSDEAKHTCRVLARDEGRLSLFPALLLLVLATVLMFGLGTGLAFLYKLVHATSMAEAERHLRGDLLSLTLIQACAMGLTLLVGLRLIAPDSPLRDGLSLNPVPLRTLILCLLAGACLQFPLTEVANILHHYVFGPDPIEQQLALQKLLSAQSFLEGLIVVGCIAGAVPLVEELLFRGLFLFGLSRRYGPFFGVLFSSVLFGIVHFGAVPALYACIAGLLLGKLALVTRSVWPGVALHAAFNAVPVLLPSELIPIEGFNLPSAEPTHLPWPLVVGALLVGLLLLAVVRRFEYAQGDE